MASKESKQLFLEVLKTPFSIARAAEAIGMTRAEALDLREQDPVFAADWDDAPETAVDQPGRYSSQTRQGVATTNCWNCC